MAKKVNAPLCDRCETPYRSASSFCPSCGGPTPWTSHEERVEWEVRQWRASRSSSEGDKPQMMLVRTEAGYEPMAVARYNDYVWDQPLHPERPAEPEPTRRLPSAPAATVRPPSPPEPPVAERETMPERANNGNSNGTHMPVVHQPAVEPAAAAPEPVVQAPAAPDAARQAPPHPEPEESLFGSADDRVVVSRKAVALGIALVVGLPFGGKLLGLVGITPSAAPRKGAVAAAPAALVAARSGFEQFSPDAVRYAVVIKNPNKSFQASGVTVNVVLHDARGRLVGTGTERVSAVPAAGALGVTGAVGVSGPASRISVKVGAGSFQEARPAAPFRVRDVHLSRSDGHFVVRASVSGVAAAKGARLVVVHLDRRGRIIGGDFTYIDVPRRPKSVSATISTAGVRGAARVEIYVLPR